MFLGDRLKTRIFSENSEVEMISSDSNSIPSIVYDDEEKYIHLPSRNNQWRRLSLRCKSKADFYKDQHFDNNAFINMVGCLENDKNKRVMVTVQTQETLSHLSSQIGQLMQKYRMFHNLLGLRATELKVITRDGHPLNHDDSVLSIRRLIRLNFGGKKREGLVEDSDEEKVDESVGKMLKDGDEFVFKLISFDKWITIYIHFELEGEPEATFNVKTEMRTAGYYQNSHLFQLVTKLAINIWNESIEEITLKRDYYVLKEIEFWNRKSIEETLDQEKKEATNTIENSGANNKYLNVMKEIKKEITSINLTKKNYIEAAIDANAKVDETFGYDSSIQVKVTFATISKALKDQRKSNDADPLQEFTALVSPSKFKNVLVGFVALPKMNSSYEATENEQDVETSFAEILPKKDSFNWFKFNLKGLKKETKPPVAKPNPPKRVQINLHKRQGSSYSIKDR